MVQQRHDEGYGLVIRSEKDDIWDRLSGSEAFRLEEKLLDEVQYRTYHNRIEKWIELSDCQEMVSYYVQAKIIENDLDVQVKNVILSGSRCRKIEKIGSDLDVVVDYKGSIREDEFFNILHETDLRLQELQ